MYQLKKFDAWNVYEDAPQGSGRSEKIWLINDKTLNTGLFKYPKIRTNGEITGEYWAEKLASELASLLGIECAKVDMGIHSGRTGSMNYNFLRENEVLIEGIGYIADLFPFYDKDKLLDSMLDKPYSIQMILKSIEHLNITREFLSIPVFDCLIGNSDRHHSNWGIVINKKTSRKKLAPLYDNGSSLCAYLNESDAGNILKDKMRFDAIVDSKSKSAIGWYDERPVRHFKMLKFLKEEYRSNIKHWLDIISYAITEESLSDIINKFPDSIISPPIKDVLLRYLIKRKNLMMEVI